MFSPRDPVPDLIALLDDPDADVARLAEDALRKLTGESREGAEAWQEWWDRHGAG